jgi:hypothetical protein
MIRIDGKRERIGAFRGQTVFFTGIVNGNLWIRRPCTVVFPDVPKFLYPCQVVVSEGGVEYQLQCSSGGQLLMLCTWVDLKVGEVVPASNCFIESF